MDNKRKTEYPEGSMYARWQDDEYAPVTVITAPNGRSFIGLGIYTDAEKQEIIQRLMQDD